MPLRLPHVSVTTASVTCQRAADLSADREASAALLEAERGEPIPLPTRIATIGRDSLQHDPDVVRHQRQTAAPRTRPPPAGQDRRPGAPSVPVPQAPDNGAVPSCRVCRTIWRPPPTRPHRVPHRPEGQGEEV